MSMRFNPPPNWPQPPEGWTPPAGWRPDPAWGPAPPGWHLWVPAAPLGRGRDGSLFPPVGQPGRPTSYDNAGTAMVAVAAASCGFAGFVPPLWAARVRRDDAAFRRRMNAIAAGLFVLMVVGFTLTTVSSDDEPSNPGGSVSDTGTTVEAGTPTGTLGEIGGALLFLNLVLSVTVAVLVRKTRPTTPLPGVAEELERRRLREQYRQLAQRDPALARSLCVGRPDLARTLDDGGLLDLNALPADQLAAHAGLSAEEAVRVGEVRERLGRFTSLTELAVFADLPEETVAALEERALFT